MVRLWKLIHLPLWFHQQSHFHLRENPSCLQVWCYSWVSVRPHALTFRNLSTMTMQKMRKQQIIVNISVILSKCGGGGHFLFLRWGIASLSLMCIFTRLCIYSFKLSQNWAEDATVGSYTKWGSDAECIEAEQSYIYKLTYSSSTGWKATDVFAELNHVSLINRQMNLFCNSGTLMSKNYFWKISDWLLAISGLVCSVLHSPVQETYGHTGVSPAKGH